MPSNFYLKFADFNLIGIGWFLNDPNKKKTKFSNKPHNLNIQKDTRKKKI